MADDTPEIEQHWPPERMITSGYAHNATVEDIQDLPDNVLMEIASLCEVPEVAGPGECTPCAALTLVEDRRIAERERLDNMAPKIPDPEEVVEPLSVNAKAEDPFEKPKLAALMSEHDVFATETEEPVESKSILMQFEEKVTELSDLVIELLHGPPVPPKNVTLEELALLAAAAGRWVRTTEANGMALSPPQQQVLDATKALVEALRS